MKDSAKVAARRPFSLVKLQAGLRRGMFAVVKPHDVMTRVNYGSFLGVKPYTAKLGPRVFQ